MNEITNLFLAVCLSSITGTCALLIWKLFLPLIQKRSLELACLFLRLMLLLYVVPLVYVRLLMENSLGAFSRVKDTGNEVIQVIAVFWLLTTGVRIVFRIPELSRILKIRKGDVPVELPYAEEIFQEVCADLKITRKISLYNNDQCSFPFFTGVIHPAVLLPYGYYNQKELRMIFCHELIHYRQHDLWFKYICIFVKMLHWFNPFTYSLLVVYTDWSETNCDLLTCRAGKKYFTRKEYFTMLLDESEESEESEEAEESEIEEGVTANLFDKRSSLENRILRIKMYKRKNPMGKVWVLLLSFVFLLVSCLPAYVISGGVVSWYDEFYLSANAVMEISNGGQADRDYMTEEFDESEWIVIEQGIDMTNFSEGMPKDIVWELGPGTTNRTQEFELAAGSSFVFVEDLTENPSGQAVKVGIMDVDGKCQYEMTSSKPAHSFSITETGLYRFYVQNLSNSQVHMKAMITKAVLP